MVCFGGGRFSENWAVCGSPRVGAVCVLGS